MKPFLKKIAKFCLAKSLAGKSGGCKFEGMTTCNHKSGQNLSNSVSLFVNNL